MKKHEHAVRTGNKTYTAGNHPTSTKPRLRNSVVKSNRSKHLTHTHTHTRARAQNFSHKDNRHKILDTGT